MHGLIDEERAGDGMRRRRFYSGQGASTTAIMYNDIFYSLN